MSILNGPHPCMLKSPPPQFAVLGGELLYDERRDARYQYFYVVTEHPLVNRDIVGPGRIIVYIQDTQKEVREKQWQFEDSIKVPRGPDANVSQLGLFEMQDGDIIFGRNLQGPRDDQNQLIPENDVVLAWCSDGNHFLSDEHLSALKMVQEIVLGERGLRTSDAAVKTNAGYNGGVAYERQDIEGIQGTRCYSAGPTHQRSRNMTSPTASGKVPDGGMTPELRARKDVVQIMAAIGVASMNKFAPEKFREQLRQHAELTNMPRIGGVENVYFPAIQLNIAPAVAGNDSFTKSLECMGEFFGIDHGDFDDDGGGLSTMIANSDVPENYEYGRFHLLAFGFWIKLTPRRIMTFSGLFKHGGSPPLSPPGITPVPWAYRFMTVLYPPRSMLSGAGNQIIGLAALPKGQLLQLPPEMTSVISGSSAFRGITNEANWANDGEVLMDSDALFQFYTRSLLQFNTYLLQQLPVSMNARLDPDTFLSAFTRMDATANQRVSAGKWETAPDGSRSAFWSTEENALADVSVPEGDHHTISMRETLAKQWTDHVSAASALIPSQRFYDARLHELAGRPVRKNASQKSKAKRPAVDSGESGRIKRLRADNGSMSINDYPVAALSTVQAHLIHKNVQPQTCVQPTTARPSSKQASPSNVAQASKSLRPAAANPTLGTRFSKRVQAAAKILSECTASEMQGFEQSQDIRLPVPAPLQQKKEKFLGVVLTRGKKGTTVVAEKIHESEELEESDDDSEYIPSCYESATPTRDSVKDATVRIKPHLADDMEDIIQGAKPPLPSSSEDLRRDAYLQHIQASNLIDNSPTHDDADDLSIASDDLPLDSVTDSDSQISDTDDSPYDFDVEVDSENSDSDDTDSEISVVDTVNEFSPIRSLTHQMPPLQQFLAGLGVAAIADAIDEMTAGLVALKGPKPTSSTAQMALSLDALTLKLLKNTKASNTSATAIQVAGMWDSIKGLERYIDVSGAEKRITRSLVILAFMSPYWWITRLINEAFPLLNGQVDRPSWVLSLMRRLDRIHNKSGLQKDRVEIFDPSSFIPGLQATAFHYTPPRFNRDPEIIDSFTRRAVMSIAEHWLGFPKESSTMQKCELMNILSRHIPSYSIYLVDSVWDLFKDPVGVLTDRHHRLRGSRSLSEVATALDQALKSHPLTNKSSNESAYLSHLDALMLLWSNEKTSQRHTASTFSSQALLPSVCPIADAGNHAFLLYLRRLLPLVNDGVGAYQHSQDSALRKAANDPDYFLPFRDVAPTRRYVITNLFSDPHRLCSAEGFGSVLLHRAFFYGSKFAKTRPAIFADISEWQEIYATALDSGLVTEKNQTYFVRNNVYGSGSKHRRLEHIPRLWNARNTWPGWLAKNPNFTFSQLLDFLQAKDAFYGVGGLTALLIAGDLAVAGVAPMPSAEELGEIIFKVGRGGLKGLQLHGLVGRSPTKEQAVEAFVSLHCYLEKNLTPAEKNAMGYHVLMVEHGLCKNTRLEK